MNDLDDTQTHYYYIDMVIDEEKTAIYGDFFGGFWRLRKCGGRECGMHRKNLWISAAQPALGIVAEALYKSADGHRARGVGSCMDDIDRLLMRGGVSSIIPAAGAGLKRNK